jgi:hypothetical protein
MATHPLREGLVMGQQRLVVTAASEPRRLRAGAHVEQAPQVDSDPHKPDSRFSVAARDCGRRPTTDGLSVAIYTRYRCPRVLGVLRGWERAMTRCIAISRSTAAAALAAVALTSAAGALCTSSASGAARSYPPCTRQALVAGLRRGVRPLQGRLVRPWACAGRFAYAGLVVEGNEGTVLFRAVGRVWKPADRGKYCADGAVPARIYQPACNSN